jgi:hypothetical protein
MALTAVLSLSLVDLVLHVGHEHAGTTFGTLTTESFNSSILIDLIIRQHSELDLLSLVLDLLGSGVNLLLSLLTTTSKTQHQMKSRLLLNIVIRKSSAILKLLTSKNQSLLVRRDAFLVLNLGLDIVNSIGRLHLKGDSLAREGFDENLHYCTWLTTRIVGKLSVLLSNRMVS